MKKTLPILIIVLAVAAGITLASSYFIKDKGINLAPQSAKEVKFQLLDGKTSQPIANKEIYICDESVIIDYVGEYPFPRYCDGKEIKIVTKAKTDSDGILILDVKQLSKKGLYSIVFDPGNSTNVWGIASVSFSDNLSHQFSPNHLRILNQDEKMSVISNLIYNIDTGMVKEIFTEDNLEKTYKLDVIKIKIFQKDVLDEL